MDEASIQLTNNEQQLFTIDLRSLAALRICLGLITVVWVVGQLSWLQQLYSEEGILPATTNGQLLGSWHWSIYWLNDSYSFAQTLMVITALAAGALLLGFQTRLATLVCLVLLWSLQVRNPLILTGGDVLLRMMLFWSLFLPMGRVWSIDASYSDEEEPIEWNVESIGTIGIMFQVAFMYFFSGIAKWNDVWLAGDAVEYSMNLDMYVKPVGQYLAGFPALLKVVTFVTLLSEILLPLILFVPRITTFNRGLAMGMFWLLHIGVWLTMSIGTFSVTAMCAWLVFVPSEIWNSMVGEPVGYSGESQPLKKKGFGTAVGCLFVAYIVLQNFANTGVFPQQATNLLERFGTLTMTIQKFRMFDRPLQQTPWFEYQATLETDEKMDLFYPAHNNYGHKPDSVYDYMQSQNWRRIHSNLLSRQGESATVTEVHKEIRNRLLAYIVESWNDKNPDRHVKNAQLRCTIEPIKLADEASEVNPAGESSKEIWATYRHEEKNPLY